MAKLVLSMVLAAVLVLTIVAQSLAESAPHADTGAKVGSINNGKVGAKAPTGGLVGNSKSSPSNPIRLAVAKRKPGKAAKGTLDGRVGESRKTYNG